MKFSNDEMNLMLIYNPGSRTGLINALNEMKKQLTEQEIELCSMTNSVLSKIEKMSEEEFNMLELYPNF